MNLEKIKCKEGIWYEDANGNYIPSEGSLSNPAKHNKSYIFKIFLD